jgi:hypothetical protein
MTLTPFQITQAKNGSVFLMDYAHADLAQTYVYDANDWGLYTADSTLGVRSTIAPNFNDDGTSMAGTITFSVFTQHLTTYTDAHVHYEGSGITMQYTLDGGTTWTSLSEDGYVTLTAGADFDIKVSFAGGVVGDTSNLTSLTVYVFKTNVLTSFDSSLSLTFNNMKFVSDPAAPGGSAGALTGSITLNLPQEAYPINSVEMWARVDSTGSIYSSPVQSLSNFGYSGQIYMNGTLYRNPSFADTFDSANSYWTYNAGAAVSGGQGVIPVNTSFTGGINSTGTTVSLVGSTVSIELVQAPANGTNSNVYHWFQLASSLSSNVNDILFSVTGGTLFCYTDESGTRTNRASVTYNPTNHKWLRFRASGGVVYWETSPDNVTWTTITSWTATFDLSSFYMLNGCGADFAGTYAPLIIDNFSYVNPAVPNAMDGNYHHFVFNGGLASTDTVTIGGVADLSIAHLAAYRNQLSPADVLSNYINASSGNILTVNDADSITVTEPATPTETYAYSWTIMSGNS